MVFKTIQREFLLLAFVRYAEFKPLLFWGVLLMYLLTVLGNMTIILLVCQESSLHTPMYFFLCNLATQDIVYVSAIQPKLLSITLTGATSIGFPYCIIQMFLFVMCTDTDFFLLTSMAYDRYVAICISLRYSLIMNRIICTRLAVSCWLFAALNSFMYCWLVSGLSYCRSRAIKHFFCEVKAVLKLSCSDTSTINMILYIEGALGGLLPFLLILTSYIFIILTIVNMRSSVGRLKAFSSCSTHLTVVILFCGTVISLYMKPDTEYSEEQDKVLSLLYVAVVPMLNPIVYSMRNKEVLKSLKKHFANNI
ncbi:olfactory receptor 2T29-like [Xenopus laevis]|uniref:Olfactory receptor n=1 Tax=Xenopus laevis TaxID=8355 RepID=A0A8J1MIG4_XENLA|nr:olfactory receptor 2T29-like [Xenopus laevis]